MNLFLKYFVYTLLTIHFGIILWELIRIPFISIPSYLSSYDLSSNKFRYIRYIVLNLVKLMLFYLIVIVVDLKIGIENVKEENVIPETDINGVLVELETLNSVVDDTPINKWKYLRNILIPYRAQICVYLYVISTNLGSFNPVMFILAPIIMYKVLYRLYSKHKYYKIFIWPAMAGLGTALYKFLELKKTKTEIVRNDEIPFEIMRYFIKRDYEVITCKVDADFYNVGVVGLMNTVAIFIFGDIWGLFSEKEFVSVLYHEIGHVMNKSLLLRGLVSKSLGIFGYILEFLMISGSRNLLKMTETEDTEEGRALHIRNYINNLIMLFILFSISIVPFIDMIDNIYSNIDEIQADRFSVMNANKKYLIRALIKLTVENKAYIDSSLMFNLMYFSHPSLKRRIEIINQM